MGEREADSWRIGRSEKRISDPTIGDWADHGGKGVCSRYDKRFLQFRCIDFLL